MVIEIQSVTVRGWGDVLEVHVKEVVEEVDAVVAIVGGVKCVGTWRGFGYV